MKTVAAKIFETKNFMSKRKEKIIREKGQTRWKYGKK